MIKKKNDLLKSNDVIELISWKAVPLLQEYMTRFDNIKPRKYSQHSHIALNEAGPIFGR